MNFLPLIRVRQLFVERVPPNTEESEVFADLDCFGFIPENSTSIDELHCSDKGVWRHRKRYRFVAQIDGNYLQIGVDGKGSICGSRRYFHLIEDSLFLAKESNALNTLVDRSFVIPRQQQSTSQKIRRFHHKSTQHIEHPTITVPTHNDNCTDPAHQQHHRVRLYRCRGCCRRSSRGRTSASVAAST